jgi:hypothetical protein
MGSLGEKGKEGTEAPSKVFSCSDEEERRENGTGTCGGASNVRKTRDNDGRVGEGRC